jgi:hypothetical protein
VLLLPLILNSKVGAAAAVDKVPLVLREVEVLGAIDKFCLLY